MSEFRRFFVNEITFPLIITGEEFNHAVNVLRVKKEQTVIVCNNSLFEYYCKVEEINKKDLVLSLLEKKESQTEAKEKVALLCGYLKGDKTELVVQKATELGVKEIVVFDSKFSSAFFSENKLARLKKVAIESAKQCGRSIVPNIYYCNTLEKALETCNGYENKLFACEFATKGEVSLKTLYGSTAIVVGSEGGFSQEEFEKATELGYKTVYLGKRILRAETACISLTAIIMNALGELE